MSLQGGNLSTPAEVIYDKPFTAADLFDRLADPVFTLAARILADPHEAEDVVQATFVTVQTRLETFRGEGSIEAWIYRIAYNESIDVLRGRRFEVADPSAFMTVVDLRAKTPEQEALDTDVREAMESALAALSTSLRAAFVLRDIQQLSTSEVASVLDTSESAVKMRLARARAAIRVALRSYL